MAERRIRARLSIGETDAMWLYTATNSLYRFHDGEWQCSRNVYYGKDRGWFGWSCEPTAYQRSAFIEMLPGRTADDPELAAIIAHLDGDRDGAP